MLSVGSIVRFMGGIAIHAKNIGKNTQRTIACVFVVITSNNVFPFCGGVPTYIEYSVKNIWSGMPLLTTCGGVWH